MRKSALLAAALLAIGAQATERDSVYAAEAMSVWVDQHGKLHVSNYAEDLTETTDDWQHNFRKALQIRQEIEAARNTSGVVHLHVKSDGKKQFLWIDSAQRNVGIRADELSVSPNAQDDKTVHYAIRNEWVYSETFDTPEAARDAISSHRETIKVAFENQRSLRIGFTQAENGYVALSYAEPVAPTAYALELAARAANLRDQLRCIDNDIKSMGATLSVQAQGNNRYSTMGLERQMDVLIERRRAVRARFPQLR
ncbi:MAG TPA: hypothetical protein VM901_01400 [Bdellovibrionota bacterium]|nr:hypothetical protein [Bdellovibrionota bacterium]